MLSMQFPGLVDSSPFPVTRGTQAPVHKGPLFRVSIDRRDHFVNPEACLRSGKQVVHRVMAHGAAAR